MSLLNLDKLLILRLYKRLFRRGTTMFRVMIGAFALLTVSACGGDHGSLIPIPGPGGSGGDGGTSCGVVCTDSSPEEVVEHCDAFCGDVVCDLQGVEECAPACEVCLTREQYINVIKWAASASAAQAYEEGYAAGYDAGFADGVDSVVCQCPTWPPADVCEPDPSSPPGHLLKECRGKPDKD